ncbi:hypothetical protein EV421DRAFT_2022386 [Armillaria borealis]|uniref:Uncharacterized protein n=1 Tax=Armillaria borealis TaxID=47425 RepID=A0AA39J6L7_9AGAR|nr:hypothetical protein EV421DRAFT_2022386 [Armillaria borealis]
MSYFEDWWKDYLGYGSYERCRDIWVRYHHLNSVSYLLFYFTITPLPTPSDAKDQGRQRTKSDSERAGNRDATTWDIVCMLNGAAGSSYAIVARFPVYFAPARGQDTIRTNKNLKTRPHSADSLATHDLAQPSTSASTYTATPPCLLERKHRINDNDGRGQEAGVNIKFAPSLAFRILGPSLTVPVNYDKIIKDIAKGSHLSSVNAPEPSRYGSLILDAHNFSLFLTKLQKIELLVLNSEIGMAKYTGSQLVSPAITSINSILLALRSSSSAELFTISFQTMSKPKEAEPAPTLIATCPRNMIAVDNSSSVASAIVNEHTYYSINVLAPANFLRHNIALPAPIAENIQPLASSHRIGWQILILITDLWGCSFRDISHPGTIELGVFSFLVERILLKVCGVFAVGRLLATDLYDLSLGTVSTGAFKPCDSSHSLRVLERELAAYLHPFNVSTARNPSSSYLQSCDGVQHLRSHQKASGTSRASFVIMKKVIAIIMEGDRAFARLNGERGFLRFSRQIRGKHTTPTINLQILSPSVREQMGGSLTKSSTRDARRPLRPRT